MFTIENILIQEIVQRLGWTLVHFVWQATAVALILAILLRVLRKSTANLRYIIACLAMAIIVVLPIITIRLVTPFPQDVSFSIEAAPEPPNYLMSVGPSERSSLKERPVTQPTLIESLVVARPLSWKERFTDFLEPVLPYAVFGWFIGVIGLSTWHLGGWMQLQRLRRRLVKQVYDSLQYRLKQLANKLGVNRKICLLGSALVQVPTVIGWLKPVILLPASALTGLSTEQLEAMLAHELAHIKRFDYLFNMLQTVVEILGFYHPAVWWVSYKIRAEREICCDDLALSICSDKVSYARALTSMEEIRQGQLAVAASGGNLFARISRLVGKEPRSNRDGWLPSVIAIFLITMLAIPTTFTYSAWAQDKTSGDSGENLAKSLHQAATAGDIGKVKSLISRGADVNSKDEAGRTALHIAALQGRSGVAQLLIANGANLHARDEKGCTPLSLAAQEGRLVMAELLIAKGADTNVKDANGNTPLHYAAIPEGSSKVHHIRVIRHLVANGADINARNAKGQTAAHVAAEGGRNAHGRTVLSLNQLGTDVNLKDKVRNNLLHVAAKQARVWVIEDLLARGANVNEKNANGQTPLHIAASRRMRRNVDSRYKIIKLLIAQGTNINAVDGNQSTALHEAARCGCADVAEVLIANGANMNAKDRHDHIPAYLAMRATYNNLVDLLIDKGTDVSGIYLTAYQGDLQKMKSLVVNGVSQNTRDETGFTPLHAAAAGGHKDIVEYLISQGADVNAEAAPGWTALSYAAAGNRMEVVELLHSKGIGAGKGASELLPVIASRGYADAAKILIELGADANIDNGRPLCEATEAGHKQIVEILISKGADVNKGDWVPLKITAKTGRTDIAKCLIAAGADIDAGDWTPLMEAAYFSKDMVKLLVSEGADVNRITNNGWSVLNSAVDANRLDIAELLLDRGAKPNVKGENFSALHLAAWYQPNFVELLISKGAEVNSKDKNGWTPLHYAGLQSIDFLVAKGADVNARTNQGETVLHLLATGGNEDEVQLILSKGIDINVKDTLGQTALHRAIVFSQSAIAKILIKKGADVNIKDNDGKTALDLAKNKSYTEIIDLLRKHGAKE
jgi:ankyrin repeat protein/beta-lactamase regulating signal transducer with metallopeptidase domain